MITIISDGVNIPWFFSKAVNKLEKDAATIVYVPSYDYIDKNGLHFSPGFSNLLWILSKKHFRSSYKVINILSHMGFDVEHHNDFEYVLSFLISLWHAEKKSILELFQTIVSSLKIRHRILPIIDPLSTTVLRSAKNEVLMPQDVDGSIETIANIEFILPEQFSVPEIIIDAINNSEKIVIAGSALSLLYLRKLEQIYKMINNFKGHIIYVLPQKLTNMDRLVLKNLNTEPTFVGLTSILNGNVDAVVVNSSESSVIQRINELNFLFYPIMFDSKDPEKRKITVMEFIKILKD